MADRRRCTVGVKVLARCSPRALVMSWCDDDRDRGSVPGSSFGGVGADVRVARHRRGLRLGPSLGGIGAHSVQARRVGGRSRVDLGPPLGGIGAADPTGGSVGDGRRRCLGAPAVTGGHDRRRTKESAEGNGGEHDRWPSPARGVLPYSSVGLGFRLGGGDDCHVVGIADGGVGGTLPRYQPGITAVDKYRGNQDTDSVRVAVLGPLEVDAVDGALGPRDRVVLTALALHCGEAVSGDRLADALWGEVAPASWSKVVQGCVVRLRKVLGAHSIETLPTGYRLAIAPDDVDVRRFERSLSRARELLVLGEPERAMHVAQEALLLWRGRPLVDAENWEPAQIEAHRLEELRMDAEELRIDAALRAGLHREVLAAARACVENAPTREHRWELLALAQYRSGRQGDALRTLNAARATLAGELGVDPGPDLLALELAVLRQDPELTAPNSLPDASRDVSVARSTRVRHR